MGISSLIHSASNIDVPEDIIGKVQGRLFIFFMEKQMGQDKKNKSVPRLKNRRAAHD